MATWDSQPFSTQPLRAGYRRADVELQGVDQAVPSYEGRLFLNRAEADRETALAAEEGYLGSFHVFGKVFCWGEDERHCEQPDEREFDRRRYPNRYAKARVRTIDGLLRELVSKSGDQATLHIVAVLPEREDYAQYKAEDVLRFERLSIVTYA